MRAAESDRARPISPAELRDLVAFEPYAASDRMGWTGLDAARYPAVPDTEVIQPPLTHHSFIFTSLPPAEVDLRYDGRRRQQPFVAGSILFIAAGNPVWWRWSGHRGSLHVYLDPAVVT